MKKLHLLAGIAAGALMAGGTFLTPAAAAPKKAAVAKKTAPHAKKAAPPAAAVSLMTNSGFEAGDTMPTGWGASGADATHHLSLTKDAPHSGKQAAKMVADAGAASSYFSYDQYVQVTPGSYTFTAWVKTDKVTGNAGWFYHVYKGSDIVVNQSLNVNTDLADWSQVTAKITVPEGANAVQIGTSLFGTGTVYFDDATLTKDAR